jgi:ATP-dependent Lon protease
MKTTILRLCFCLFVLMAGTVQTVNAQEDVYGKEMKLTEAESYALKKPGTRAAGKGVSSRESVAVQVARAQARAAFAEAISSAVNSALKISGFDVSQYAGDDEEGHEVSDGAEKTNTMIKSVSKQVIENTQVVKTNKFYNKKTRKYTVFVCLEYNGDIAKLSKEIANKVSQKISDEQRMKIDFELENFEKEIEKELGNNTTEEDDE